MAVSWVKRSFVKAETTDLAVQGVLLTLPGHGRKTKRLENSDHVKAEARKPRVSGAFALIRLAKVRCKWSPSDAESLLARCSIMTELMEAMAFCHP